MAEYTNYNTLIHGNSFDTVQELWGGDQFTAMAVVEGVKYLNVQDMIEAGSLIV